eukprot:2082087-Prymnesium_polylepis.4
MFCCSPGPGEQYLSAKRLGIETVGSQFGQELMASCRRPSLLPISDELLAREGSGVHQEQPDRHGSRARRARSSARAAGPARFAVW